jgi:hypothetical protein
MGMLRNLDDVSLAECTADVTRSARRPGLRPGVAGCLLAAFATRVGSMTPEC